MPIEYPSPLTPAASKAMLERLHKTCSDTMTKSLDAAFGIEMGKLCVFAHDLNVWRQVLSERPESALYIRAEQEYLTAIVNLGQGQYRNAFKGLRLVLELCMQGVYLSANLVELQEWLANLKDTNWSELTDSDKGPLSKRYCRAFFSEIEDHTSNFQSMAKTVYRELSETVHGNTPHHIPMPDSFEFNEEAFATWKEKAKIVRLTISFCLTSRYLKILPAGSRARVEDAVIEQLGHIEAVRVLFGGPKTL